MLAVYLQNMRVKYLRKRNNTGKKSKEINSNFIDGDLSAILLENFNFWVNIIVCLI